MRENPPAERSHPFLAGLLLAAAVAAGCASSGGTPSATSPSAPFPAATDAAAWERLSRGAPPLPAWARTLVDALPATTAAQLDLDFVHRRRNPLGPVLSARVRWVVADANRCAAGRETAAFDLAAAGWDAERLASVEATDDPAEAAAFAFARRLTLEASRISDEEVRRLVELLGPDDVVALVHAVAHGNFQDRILHGLGLAAGGGTALPPREARLHQDQEPAVPARAAPAASAGEETADAGRSAWDGKGPEELRALLEVQKGRAARIPPPDGVRKARLPRPNRQRQARVAWGAVTMGYQPELTQAWFRTMETFQEEAKLDEVFTHSVFWVVTRTSDCFY